MNEPVKKFAVEYYDVSYPSGGGYWRTDVFEDIHDAVAHYLKHESGYLGTFHPRFYLMKNIPLKISFSSRLKEFILHFKFPNNIEVTVK